MTYPAELGTVEQILERYSAAVERKSQWVDLLQECYDYALPHRDDFYHHSRGQRRNQHIFDSTAPNALRRFVSRLQATIVPPWRNWTQLAPGTAIPQEFRSDPELMSQLEQATDVFFAHINHSNFVTQVAESFMDYAVSTGCLLCEEGDGDELLQFQAVPLSAVFLEEAPNGQAETVFRCHEIAARHIERLIPGVALSIPDTIKKMQEQSPDEKLKIIEGCVYAARSKTYGKVYILEMEKHVLYSETVEVSPWIIFRGPLTPGEIYGRGPVIDVLPDIKTLNKVKEFTLQNAALAIAGLYTATDDGVFNPYNVRLAPGTVLPVDSNDSSNPSIRPLDRSGDFNLSYIIMEDLQNNIKGALFNNMRRAEGPVKSATEIAIDNRELVEEMGASFGRLQSEFVEKTVKRVMHILIRNGKMPDIQIDGQQVTLKHMSPLARAQDDEEIENVVRYFQLLQMAGPEAALLGIDTDKTPEIIAQRLGIDIGILPDEEGRETIKANIESQMAGPETAQ